VLRGEGVCVERRGGGQGSWSSKALLKSCFVSGTLHKLFILNFIHLVCKSSYYLLRYYILKVVSVYIVDLGY
jgi:hypothetical protein